MKQTTHTSFNRRRQEILLVILLLFPAMCSMLLFTYYPMVKGWMMAFQSYNLMNAVDIHWIGLENFRALFSSSSTISFSRVLVNTLCWVAVSLFFQFLIGFGLALLLRRKFPGSGLYQGIVFFPWAVSGFLIGLIWRWLFNGTSGVINDILMRMGAIDTPVSWLAESSTALAATILANVWYGVPFFTIMILAALRGIPKELYEAADIDGASSVQRLFRVVIPSIRHVLLLTLLMRAIWIFNFPELIYSMTNGGPGGSTHILTSYVMQKVQALDYGQASALGILCVIFLSLYTILYLRFARLTESDE